MGPQADRTHFVRVDVAQDVGISLEDCLASVEGQHRCLEEVEDTILEVVDKTAEDYKPVGLLGARSPFHVFAVLLD